ncbi:MAG: DUF4910 domain-containing protein [Clostridiales bacterium]|nr:DUF4910 domain-containing protein [Clostridiales bacterium]
MADIQNKIFELARELFPICRSITGDGVRKTLSILNNVYPVKIHNIASGTTVSDWSVPLEWNIKSAYIKDCSGNRIIDLASNNLHVVGYSIPVDKILSLEELLPHIYTDKERPDAIPYVTSYYKERWGFCMSENQKSRLPAGNFHVFIDSTLEKGNLTYGEIFLPGKSDKEILLSTYICHPSMANNEVSGPALTIYLAKYLSGLDRRYSYRILFLPETIGSITYISQNISHLQKHVAAGFVLSCVGDDRAFSYVASPYGNTLADKALKNVLRFEVTDFKSYSFLERGSDERQYCSPLANLPVCGFCRSKYGEYPEYHTSDDNMSIISPSGFLGSYNVMRECITALESNFYYKTLTLCEPQLGKRGLYPTESFKGSAALVRSMTNFIAYADGKNDLIDISNIINNPVSELIPIVQKLLREKIIEEKELESRNVIKIGAFNL